MKDAAETPVEPVEPMDPASMAAAAAAAQAIAETAASAKTDPAAAAANDEIIRRLTFFDSVARRGTGNPPQISYRAHQGGRKKTLRNECRVELSTVLTTQIMCN